MPALKQRYLGYVREIAGKWLDWNHLGAVALRYHALIDPYVRLNNRQQARHRPDAWCRNPLE